VAENAGTATYTLVLKSEPAGPVTVTPLSSDTDNATVSGALTFTPDNWNVAQTVTVTVTDDDVPVFTSAAVVTSPENTLETGYTAVASAGAAPVTYAITGGADALGFVIDERTGQVVFRIAPDYEAPGDDSTDNVYHLTVTATASDGINSESASQDVTITVTDVDEPTTGAVDEVGSITFIVTSEDAGSIRFTSATDTLNDISITAATSGGDRHTLEVPAGRHIVSYTLAEGYAVTTASCTATGDNRSSGSVDRRTRRIDLDIQADATLQCAIDIHNAAAHTAREVQDFLADRARLILSHRADPHRRMARLKRETQSGGLSVQGHKVPEQIAAPLSIAIDGTTGSEQAALRYSCTQRGAGDHDMAGCSEKALWLEGTLGRYGSGDEATGRFAIVHGGLDRLVNRDLLVGIGVQYDHITREGKQENEAADITGDGWMVGPYMTARLSEKLYFDGSISAGKASNRITLPGQGTDKYASSRLGAYGTLFGDYDRGNINIRPSGSLVYFEETAPSWHDNNGIRIPEFRTRQVDMEAGLRITQTMADGVSSRYIEVEGVFALSDTEEDKHKRLRAGAGATVRIPFGGILDAGVTFDGLGDDDWQSYAFTLGYSVSPSWLPGNVEAGLSFDGEDIGEWNPGTLRLGFRSNPDARFGGVFSSELSLGGAGAGDEDALTGKSVRVGYELRF